MVLEYACAGQHWVTPDKAALRFSTEEAEEMVEDGDPYLLESQDFIDAIRNGTPTTTPARHGLDAICLVSAVMQSAGCGMAPVPVTSNQ